MSPSKLSNVSSEPLLHSQKPLHHENLTDLKAEDEKERAFKDEEVLRQLRSKERQDQNTKFYEALQRGRHPRSFPLRTPLWQHIGTSSRRLVKLQAGCSLSSILDVDEKDARSLQKEYRANQLHELQRQQSLSQDMSSASLHRQPTLQHISVQSSRPHGVGLGQNRGMLNQGMWNNDNKKGRDSNKLIRAKDQEDLVKSNPIALAQGYVAQYKSSEIRRDRIARRMSDFRQVARTRLEGTLRKQDSVQSLATLNQYSSMKSRRGLVDISEDGEDDNRTQNVKRGLQEYHRKRAARTNRNGGRNANDPVGTFLNLARRQGHHSQNDTVRRFLDKKDREDERNAQKGNNILDRSKLRSSPVKTAGEDTSDSNRGNESAQSGGVTSNAQSPGTNAPPTTAESKSKAVISFSDWLAENGGDYDDDSESFRTIEFVPPSMPTRLFYGSQVALEAHDGSFLTASGPKGELSWMAHPKSQSEDHVDTTKSGANGNTNHGGNVGGNEDDDDDDDANSEASDTGQRRPLTAPSDSGDGKISGFNGASHDQNNAKSTKPQIVFTKAKYTMLFTLVNLHDPEYVGPVNAGDDVWLCIHPGIGQFSWKDGSIIGTRVSGGATIDTVSVDRTQVRNASNGKHDKGVPGNMELLRSGTTSSENDADEQQIGHVLPILTCIPKLPGQAVSAEKSLDELFRDASNFDRVQRMNKSATHLGQWRFGVASNQQLERIRAQRKHHSSLEVSSMEQVSGRKSEKVHIESDMHIYLEQDLAFLSANDIEGVHIPLHDKGEHKESSDPVKTMAATLQRLPKQPLTGPFCVARSGVFKVKVVQTKLDLEQSRAATGYAKGEHLLMKARVQLKRSELSRHGQHRYMPGLASGKKFSRQLRKIRQRSQHDCDEAFLTAVEEIEPKQKQHEYFYGMYQRSPEPSPVDLSVLMATESFRSPSEVSHRVVINAGTLSDIKAVDHPHHTHNHSHRSTHHSHSNSHHHRHQSHANSNQHHHHHHHHHHQRPSSRGHSEADDDFDEENSSEDEDDWDEEEEEDGQSCETESKPQTRKRATTLRGPQRRKSSARDLLDEVRDPALRDFILARQSEPYKQRLEEYGGVVPWFDTVQNLKLQDVKLNQDLKRGQLRAQRGLGLLNRGFGNLDRKRQREFARWMNTPMYRRLLEEDQRIKQFVENQNKELTNDE